MMPKVSRPAHKSGGRQTVGRGWTVIRGRDPGRSAGPSKPAPGVVDHPDSSQRISFHLESLGFFSQVITNPRSSLPSIKEAQIRLRSLIEREEFERSNLKWLVGERRQVADGLLTQLDGLIRKKGGSAFGGSASRFDEEEDGDEEDKENLHRPSMH